MRFALLAFAMFSLSACGAKYRVGVDGLAARDTKGAKIFLIDTTNADNLERAFYEKQVSAALRMSGYDVVSDRDSAELFVGYSYGMSSEKKIESSPVYNYVAPQSYSYNARTTTPSGYGYNTSGNIYQTSPGQLQYAGSRVEQVTEFTRGIYMECIVKPDPKNKEKKPDTIWKTTMVSIGYSGDMRSAFPVMLSAGINLFGKDTKGMQFKTMYEIDAKKLKDLAEGKQPEAPRGPTAIHP